jgi:tripartite-type tricarboxylate transporter receptor subunit TctC
MSQRFPRRQFLQLAAGAAVLPAVPRVAAAETYPSRPVRMIVGLPAGNSPDIVARLVCQWLSERLGKAFVVENRPGAATGLATEVVVRSAADGYTLLLVLAGNAVNGAVYQLNYDFIADIAPAASIGGIPLAMVVTPSLPVKTVPEFIAYAKANPGKLLMGSSGNGSLPHILGAMFAMMAGVDLVHVPYRESVFPDLLGGHIQLAFEPVPAVLGYIKAGKLRGLAVSTKQRLAVLPDLPTLDEFLPGYEATGWLGIGAPRNTSAEIIDTLNKLVNAGLADPALKARLLDLGVIPNPMTTGEFKTFIAAETAKWAKVVKFANIKVE